MDTDTTVIETAESDRICFGAVWRNRRNLRAVLLPVHPSSLQQPTSLRLLCFVLGCCVLLDAAWERGRANGEYRADLDSYRCDTHTCEVGF